MGDKFQNDPVRMLCWQLFYHYYLFVYGNGCVNVSPVKLRYPVRNLSLFMAKKLIS